MNKELLAYIERIKGKRKVAIWGTGNCSYIAEDILNQLNISDYIYIDGASEKQRQIYKGRRVMSPSMIGKNYFILISTSFFPEISVDLYIKGYRDLEDYVNVMDLDYYEAFFKNYDAPRVPEVNMDILNCLEKELKDSITCEDVTWFDEDEFIAYEQSLGFVETYKKGYELIWEKKPYSRYRRKIMEYYIVDKLLNFKSWSKEDIFLDLGAQTSPYAKYLREIRGITAYGIDLEKSIYSDLGYYLQEDVTNLRFADNSIRAMSAQSAFETFTGTTDSELIREAARVLKQEGKLIIIPLYLHEKYISSVSPTYYKKGTADEESFECIRTDCRGGLEIGRFYDINALKKRVLDVAEDCGLITKIYVLPNELVECDSFVYLKFILVLEKS